MRGDEQVGWDLLVPRLVNPVKVIILESMLWIERPLSATELEQISARDPDVRTFSYHLKNLERLGVLKAIAKVKTRKSRSSNKETFFYFPGRDRWAGPVALLDDPADPLTQVALKSVAT